jgi:hypothetical protein
MNPKGFPHYDPYGNFPSRRGQGDDEPASTVPPDTLSGHSTAPMTYNPLQVTNHQQLQHSPDFLSHTLYSSVHYGTGAPYAHQTMGQGYGPQSTPVQPRHATTHFYTMEAVPSMLSYTPAPPIQMHQSYTPQPTTLGYPATAPGQNSIPALGQPSLPSISHQ